MSQVIGTFSAPGGHFQITSDGISFIDDIPEGTVKEVGFLSENSSHKIPQNLIRDCIDRYEQTGIIHLILDISDKAKIYKLNGSLDEERAVKIDSLLNTKFEVVSWYDLMEFPSRQTFYDSITRHTDLFERHKFVLDFMNSLNFQITNLMDENKSQQEILWDCYQREYSYISQESNRIIIRVKPNLMIEVLVSSDKNDSVEVNKRYFFFYNPSQIFDIIIQNTTIEEQRNLKLKSILT